MASQLTLQRLTGRRQQSATTFGRALPLLVFIAPAVAFYGYFVIVPTLRAFQYAVTNGNGYSSNYKNVGTTNFRLLFTNDSAFTNALVNSVKLMLAVVIAETIIAFGLAVLLTSNTPSSKVFRTVLFFPAILSAVSVAYAWTFVYDPTGGLLNALLRDVGLGSVRLDPLGSSHYAIYSVAVVQVWQYIGEMVLLFVAGLQQIPTELYEAASVDGASRWHQLRYVTRPLIMPTLILVATFTMIQSFQAFQLVFGLSGQPPSAAVDILSTHILSTFANSRLGYAAAESIIFMAIIGTIAVLQRRLLRPTQGAT
ncbi:MAG: carbohydrate ABC transporter permease [Acidimicrobiales bacterium]